MEQIDLSIGRMKELSGNWLVEAVDYISDNPSILVNGFIKAGISGSISDSNGTDEDEEENEMTDEYSSDEYSETDSG